MKINFNEIGVKAGDIKDIEIYNMVSDKGTTVPNQYEVYMYTTQGTLKCFYSYDSFIVARKNGLIYRVGTNWDYSRTTGKYRNSFLGWDKKELENNINKNMVFNKDLQVYILKD